MILDVPVIKCECSLGFGRHIFLFICGKHKCGALMVRGVIFLDVAAETADIQPQSHMKAVEGQLARDGALTVCRLYFKGIRVVVARFALGLVLFSDQRIVKILFLACFHLYAVPVLADDTGGDRRVFTHAQHGEGQPFGLVITGGKRQVLLTEDDFLLAYLEGDVIGKAAISTGKSKRNDGLGWDIAGCFGCVNIGSLVFT